MMVVSFYTPEYKGEVAAFGKCCEQCGLMFHAQAMESKGSWRLNCGMKAKFLIAALEVHQQPILWVDIDGRIRERPEALMTDRFIDEYDFACWFIPNGRMQSRDIPSGPHSGNDGTASGTMWFNFSPMSMRFLEIWEQEERGQGQYEQKVLGETWYNHKPSELRTYRLPQEYCKVFDVQWFDRDHGEVVVEHMQASRRLRRKVK